MFKSCLHCSIVSNAGARQFNFVQHKRFFRIVDARISKEYVCRVHRGQKRIVQFHVVLNAGCRQYNFVEQYQTPRTHLLMLKLVSCISFSFRITLV